MSITFERQADGTYTQVDDPPKLADMVAVVRCRDCRHYTEDEMEYYHYCNSWCGQVKPDGFCAWGERRNA